MPREPKITGLRRWLRLPDRPVERDVDDEIAFHLESRVRALVARGHPEADARRIAVAEFGDVRASRRELAMVDRRRRRRQVVIDLAESIAQDARYAARTLRRAPAFTVTAITTLAIGIGAATAIFTVVDDVLLRPLPFKNPHRLVGVWYDMPAIGLTHVSQAAITYFTYRSLARSIDGIGIYEQRDANVAGESGARDPQRVATAWFTADLFRVLGVEPLRGRTFTAAEDQPRAPLVAVISEDMWRTRFGSDSSVVGKSFDVNGERHQIIGIMPRRFRFPSAETQLWLPLALDTVNPPATAFNYPGIARLKPGVSLDDARRELAALLPRVAELYPAFVPGITTRAIMAQAKPQPVLTWLHDDVTGAIAGTLWMVAAAAALLLAVAFVNVANLTLVRFDARRRELAVHEALGAGRGRVARFHFSECLTLAAAGGVLGIGAAWATVRALVTAGPANIPRLAEIRVDGPAVAFGLALAVLAALSSGAFPMVRIRRGTLALRESSRGVSAGREQQRLRGSLVAAQIALGLVVLTGSGLLLRSFMRLHALRPGFDAGSVATMWVSPPHVAYPGDSSLVRFYASLIDDASRLPGVTSVGVTTRLPFVIRGLNENPIYPEGAATYDTKLPPLQLFATVGGEYFRTMRIPLIAGRAFEPPSTEREGSAIISSRTAELFWHDPGGRSVIGKRFKSLPNGPWSTVVGVVGDVRDTSLAGPVSALVYFPAIVQHDTITPHTGRTMALVVRTRGDPAAIAPALRRVVRDLDPALPTFNAQPMSAALGASTARLAFVILLLGGAAAVTLILAAVGLYGVMAYLVTLRRRELGLRIALGATPRGVAAMTTRHGLRLTAAGTVAGLVVFAGTARFMRAFLFGITPWDPLTVASAVAVLFVVAGAASWVPARRAARIDPAEALRAE